MESLGGLFVLGFLLPAYTLTGFDASAHAAEETIGAARNVPRGIVRSVAISGFAGWLMLSAIVLAIPNPAQVAAKGERAFAYALSSVLPASLVSVLGLGIILAMYGCGLGAVTSASRMAFAFARDGGLPLSNQFRHVSPKFRTPSSAIWSSALLAWAFTLWTPVYATITAICTIFLYISYVLPTALGVWASGRTWTRMGPWLLGPWYRPLAVISAVGCVALILIGVQPPNQKSAWIVVGTLVVLALVWFGHERRRFKGPPRGQAAVDPFALGPTLVDSRRDSGKSLDEQVSEIVD
jgi:amino acid transporter